MNQFLITRILPATWLLMNVHENTGGMPIFKKVMLAFYVGAGVMALGVLGWYLYNKIKK